MSTCEAIGTLREELGELDFTPELPCANPDCDRPAEKVVRCRKYPGRHVLICGSCLAYLLEILSEYSSCGCAHCGETGRCLHDVADVVDI